MTTEQVSTATGTAAVRWYALSADDVARRLSVDPVNGLTAMTAGERLRLNGPNALPADQSVSANAADTLCCV